MCILQAIKAKKMTQHCCVVGCTNGVNQLNKWKVQGCADFNCKREQCGHCSMAFHMLKLSHTRNNSEREIWVNNVNRVEVKDRTISVVNVHTNNIVHKLKKKVDKLEPSLYDVICSHHFKDVRPTRENPFPTANMGHLTVKRKFKRAWYKEMSHLDNGGSESTCSNGITMKRPINTSTRCGPFKTTPIEVLTPCITTPIAADTSKLFSL